MQLSREHTARVISGKHRPHRPKAASLTVSALLSVAVCVSQVPSASAAPSTVSFTLSMQNANVKFSDPLTYDIVQAFEAQNPNIKVVVSGQPVDQHNSFIESAASTHTLPDVFWVEPQIAEQLPGAGDVLNLAPIFKSLNITTHFSHTMLAAYTLPDGFQYGMPYQPLVTGFFYNRALLQKYNVALPTTFDQLVAAAKIFASHNLVTISQGALNTDFAVWTWLTAMDRFGYQPIYKQLLAGKVSYNNANFLRYYEDLQELTKAGAFGSQVSTINYAQALQNFLSGKAVMVDAGVWATAQIQASSIGDEVGFWNGPLFENGVGDQKILMDVPDAPLSVSSAVKNDPAVMSAIEKFIAFYYGPAGQQLFVKNGQPPVTTYVPTVNTKTQPLFANILQQLRDPGWTSALFQPDQPMTAALQTALYASFNGIFEGIYTPQKALQLVETAIQAGASS
jgi:raffinose/stachyose/melibiose transport system substrate-binding protein